MSNTKIQVQETQNKQDKYQNKLSKNPKLQEIILEWVAMPFSRGSPQPRDQTSVSCIAGKLFTTEPQKLFNVKKLGVGLS